MVVYEIQRIPKINYNFEIRLKGDTQVTKKGKNNTELFVFPGFIGVLIFVIMPLIDVIRRSFQLGGMGAFVGIENYKTVISNEAFQLAVENNFWFVVISVFFLMLISLIVSIEVHNMKNNLIRFAFLIPLTIPSNAMAVVWKILFSDAGIVNNILVKGLHMEPICFFEGKNVFVLFVGTFVFKNVGYNMLIWISGLYAIPQEIYEAAKVDGAGYFRSILYITLPNIKRSAFIATILSMVNSFKIFRELYLIAGSYPDMNIYQLQHVFNNWFLKLEVNKLSAGAVLTAIVILVVILIIRIMILTEWKEVFQHIRLEKWRRTGMIRYKDRHCVKSMEGAKQCDEKEDI